MKTIPESLAPSIMALPLRCKKVEEKPKDLVQEGRLVVPVLDTAGKRYILASGTSVLITAMPCVSGLLATEIGASGRKAASVQALKL
jgi:hypothetical protein